MSLVENEITRKNIEQARTHSEFERRTETERKLLPSRPEIFEQLYRQESYPVEQVYLSTPDDEFSLRVRCSYRPEGPTYSATLKDRGKVKDGALHRSEIDTEISEAAYIHFSAMDLPRVRKLRCEISETISVDFYDDSETPVVVEIEHPDEAERSIMTALVESTTLTTLLDRSEDKNITSEAIAHKRLGKYAEAPGAKENLDQFSERVFREMVAHYASGKNQVVVGLTGMSGSGKTTVTRAIEDRMVELFGEAMRPIVVSTDDYHFGKTALEDRYGAPYTDWDSPHTYNTEALAEDIKLLAKGQPLLRRHFNFDTEEPQFDTIVEAAPFVLVEGLYAGSPDLACVRSLYFELPTTVATSIGRDVRRLIIEDRANRAFPTPESRLKYQIETALPLYQSIERPRKHSFNASSRTLGERAFMLERITR